MKTGLGLLLPVWLASIFVATGTETLEAKEFSITGEFNSESELEIETSVAVFKEVLTENGSVERIELASGVFVDGEVILSGMVDSPTDVTLSVTFNVNDPISISAVIAPDDDILFRVLQADDGTPNQVMFVGSVRLSSDESTKFTVTGDLSSLQAELQGTTVKVTGYGDGKVGTINYGSVLVAENGTFRIENDIDEPRVVWIIINNDKGLNSVSQTILEPQVSISVAPDAQGSELVLRSDSDFHVSLFESWAKSDEYLALGEAHRVALKKYQKEMAALQAAAEQKAQEDGNESENTTETTANNDGSDTSQDDLENESKETSPILALANGIPPIKECEHVDLTHVKPGIMDYVESTYPEYFKLQREMTQFRYRALEKIASTSDDPMESLLAIEIDAFGTLSEGKFGALEVMDRLAPRLDDELASRRLVPLRSKMEPDVKLEIANRNLVPGQKAPIFKLPDLDGVDVSLQQALDSNDVVLVEFWASWCTPCIRKMPDLKKLHASYAKGGFQVLTINTDDHYEEWKEESNKHQFEWIDLGELEGEGEKPTPVQNSYGVLRLPAGYLVDKQGCIVQKDLRIDMLTEFLVEKYGEIPEEAGNSPDESSG